MKYNPILEQNFRNLYKPESWFADECTCDVKPLSPLNFTLASSRFPAFTRTERTLISSFDNGEKYTVYDLYKLTAHTATAESNQPLIKVYTHLFNTVEEARKGYFHLLGGSEILNSRNEGAPSVGEVSYSNRQYVCFIRNNIVIRFIYTAVSLEAAEAFMNQIDRQIIEESKGTEG
jgi:hypothetical protein